MRNRQRDTVIRATCERCGDVELRVADVRVLLCAATNEGSYAFRCPTCGGAVAKPADARTVDVLIAAGVELAVWDLPAELDEPHAGPPFTFDDLIELHFWLESGEAAAALGALGAGSGRAAHPAGGRRPGRAGR